MIITIRQAKLEDYEALMKLYSVFVGEDRYSKHNNDSFDKVLNSQTGFIYVAEEGDKVVGFISYSMRNVVRYAKPIIEVDELFVALPYRKHGVGGKLMEQMEEKSRDLDCYGIFIESHYKHKTAHKFYEDLGYKNYGYHFKKVL